MIERVRGRWLAAVLSALLPLPALAQDAPDVTIGYVELADDPRYDPDYAYAEVPVRPLGRPLAGVEVGIADAAPIGTVIGVGFDYEQATGATLEELAATVTEWSGSGVHYVVADLPAAALVELADHVADQDVILFNVSAYEDELRGASCRANVVHVIPSYAMLADALMQYLATRRWLRVLVLQGPLEADAALVEAVQRSAGRFGTEIVDVRPFVLTNDPRLRERSNVALITEGSDYDVVLAVDTDGEYARYVPYQTRAPRPVVGTAGLVPTAWHWSWERHGAPQLETRYEAAAGHRMDGSGWAAWAAVKSIVQSVLRAETTDFAQVRDYLLGDQMNLDGSKGNPMSVRSWDQQVRQPVLLATGNAVIARAPLEGFLHQTNELDTLGIDAPETQCTLNP